MNAQSMIQYGLLAASKRIELERAGWLYCGSWMGVFHYFKRETQPISV
jgi:hypothetical protein